MSVKKEPSGRRSVQVEVEVPGTPEQVWRAIATGAGVSSWFVPTEIEERVGGKVISHFGPGMDSVATITLWNPPFHFAAESPGWVPNAPPIADEFFVEARSGGVCVVRVVHSLFAETDDWDDQLEGTESGWPVYFRILRLYLKHFGSTTGRSMIAMCTSQEPESQTWSKLMENLGFTAYAPGRHCKTAPGVPQISGTVESSSAEKSHYSLMIRLDEPAPGIVLIGVDNCAGAIMVTVSLYLYGPAAQQEISQQESAWQAWLNERFPADPSHSAPNM